MNAVEFVKKYGLEESAKITNESIEFGKNVFYDLSDELYYGSDFGGRICVNDLKQIVDAWELVEFYGGLDGAKGEYFEIVHSGKYDKHSPTDIAKAINLVEQCQ